MYGKGKLAEIQGLILGMLDTFNYEQVKKKTHENESVIMSEIYMYFYIRNRQQ